MILTSFMVSSAELTVLVVLSHGERYGVEIMGQVSALTGREVRRIVGGLYTMLDRMERKGYIRGRWGDSGAGARRRYYAITKRGAAELLKVKQLVNSAR